MQEGVQTGPITAAGLLFPSCGLRALKNHADDGKCAKAATDPSQRSSPPWGDSGPWARVSGRPEAQSRELADPTGPSSSVKGGAGIPASSSSNKKRQEELKTTDTAH